MALQVQGNPAGKSTETHRTLPKFSKKDFLETFMVLPRTRFEKTDSGLRFVTVREGKGEPLEKGMRAKVQYTGWLENGKKFDSSVGKKHPFEFTLGSGQVIKGWEEGLEGIKPGERRQLIIPHNLAYGNQRKGNIPPRATLIFNVEAVAIEEVSSNPKGNMSITA